MKKLPTSKSSVGEFLDTAKRFPIPSDSQTRLVFAMDATQSREPTWDLATSLHAELFTTARQEDLAIQLVYYRGFNEFYATHWSDSASALLQTMQHVQCVAGLTQISSVLSHTIREAQVSTLKALAFVGDACEEEPQALYDLAGQLALYRLPVFMFQEGHDPYVAEVFAGIAQLTKGAHIPFQPGSAQQFAELLRAVAAYATGGVEAVKKLQGKFTQRLLEQLQS
ncbi:MAG: VWA domain-containing protein [Gammaproteobacteria bacterium]|nr:VWA domain-containing protein [Gammaproteobacteria bacterium]